MGFLKPLRWLGVGTAIVVLLGAIFFGLNPSLIRVEQVEIELDQGSNQYLLFQRIKNGLKPQLQFFSGKYFWDFSLEQIYNVVKKDRRVRNVSIYREFPSRLRVEIDPQTPLLAYLLN